MTIIQPNGDAFESTQVTPESMLDVIAEAREHGKAQVAAAQTMIVPHAIRAILDGVDPKIVAKACGYEVDEPVEQAPRDLFEEMWGSSMLGMGHKSRRVRDPMIQFSEWLGDKLAEYVREHCDPTSE